jgi:heme exporter protein A
MAPHPVLQLHNICHRFGSQWALSHASLQVPTGQTVLLTGHNGAGKTTLLRIVATALQPSRGSLQIFGIDALALPQQVRPRLGLVSHQHFMYEALSASQNLQALCRLVRPASLPQVPQVLQEIGLERCGDAALSTFSAGMKRRLALGRLLLLDPEVVLLDEPFGQLDPQGVALVEQVLQRFRTAGKTLLLCTHDVERGQALCDVHVHLGPGGLIPQNAAVRP